MRLPSDIERERRMAQAAEDAAFKDAAESEIITQLRDDLRRAREENRRLREALRDIGLHVENGAVVVPTAGGTMFRLASLMTPAGKTIAAALAADGIAASY